MKKLLSLLLALAMVLALAACGAKDDAPADDTTEPDDPQAPQTELSATVQQLYDEFDAAMEEQLGAMPENYGDVKVGAVVISLTNAFWANMKDCYEEAGKELGITGVYGREINGGAAELLDMRLNPGKKLKSITVRTLSNDVVIGLMGITLQK